MAYDFNGSNNYITLGTAPVTAVPLTIACWVNMDVERGGDMGIVAIGDSNLRNSFRLSINNRRIRIYTFAGGNSSSAEASPQPAVGTWYHGAGVFTAINSRTAYVNGGSPNTNTGSRTPSGIDRGSIGSNLTSDFADGQVAEVGIWNAALTAAEIFSLFRGFTPPQIRPESLVFYAPLIRDLADYRDSNNLTNINSVGIANHPRIYS